MKADGADPMRPHGLAGMAVGKTVGKTVEKSAAYLDALPRPVAHIVHIGAGTGGDLSAYLGTGAGVVTLVEADRQAVAGLEVLAGELTGGEAGELTEKLTGIHPTVQVIEAAVSVDTHARVFRLTNFPELNSLRKPTGLKALFPGLRTLSEEQVKPVDPAQLIGDLGLSGTGSTVGHNLLVIEAPGEAMGILEGLLTAGLLMVFDTVRLQEARGDLYHEAPTVEAICKYLVGAGYTVGYDEPPEDPERPYLTARMDRAAVATAKAARQIEDLTAALAEATQKVEYLKSGFRDTQHKLWISLGLPIQRESDLKDLQARYARLLQDKDAQDELLERLTASLRSAAQYFRDMEDAPPATPPASTPASTPAKTTRRKKAQSGKGKPGKVQSGKAKPTIAPDE